MKNNIIKHQCIFCKKDEIELSWEKREQKCSCGIVYLYKPNSARDYIHKNKKQIIV